MPNTKTISHDGKTYHHAATVKTTPKSDTTVKKVYVKVNNAERQKIRLEENKEYLKNPNMKAFLSMISLSEGGDYHGLFGWLPHNKWTFTSEKTHPGPGIDGVTTAAGLYQINIACWKEHGIKAQGLNDFSPDTQDLIAVDNIRAHKSLQSILDGDIKTPINTLKSNQWTSFKVHSYNQLESWYKAAGGSVK